MMGFCQGPLCVEPAYRADYCDNCEKLRVQHATNHRYEGHSRERILMCPTCETLVFQQGRIEDILG